MKSLVFFISALFIWACTLNLAEGQPTKSKNSERVGKQEKITRRSGNKTPVEKIPDYALSIKYKSMIRGIPLSSNSQLSVSTESKHKTRKGFLLGSLSGALTGGMVGVIIYKPCNSDEFLGCMMSPKSRGGAFVTGSLVGGALGMIVGTIIGASNARDTRKKAPAVDRKWSAAIYIGGGNGKMVDDIKDAMTAYGFDDRSKDSCFFGLCLEGRSHPRDYGGGIFKKADLKYYVKKGMSVGLTYNVLNDIIVAGHHSGFRTLHIDTSVKSIAPILSITTYNFATVGLGPSLFFTRTGSVLQSENAWQSKVGGQFYLAVKVPARSRFFLSLNFQHMLAGKVDIGPYKVTDYSGTASVDFPKTKINFSHTAVGFGIGIRL